MANYREDQYTINGEEKSELDVIYPWIPAIGFVLLIVWFALFGRQVHEGEIVILKRWDGESKVFIEPCWFMAYGSYEVWDKKFESIISVPVKFRNEYINILVLIKLEMPETPEKVKIVTNKYGSIAYLEHNIAMYLKPHLEEMQRTTDHVEFDQLEIDFEFYPPDVGFKSIFNIEIP